MKRNFKAVFSASHPEGHLCVSKVYSDDYDFCKGFFVGQNIIFPTVAAQGWEFNTASITDRKKKEETHYTTEEIKNFI